MEELLRKLREAATQKAAQLASNKKLNLAASSFQNRVSPIVNKVTQSGALGPLPQALTTPKVYKNTIGSLVQGARGGYEMAPHQQILRLLENRQLTNKQRQQAIGNYAKGIGTMTLGPGGYLAGMGIGAGFNKLTGGSAIEGAYQGLDTAQQYGGLGRATAPLVSGALTRFAPPALTGRIGQGIANTAEGLVLDPLAGRPVNLESMAFDFAMGAAGQPFEVGKTPVKGMDKNAILTNDQAKRVGRIMKEYESSGKLTRDAIEDAWRILTKDTKKMASKEGRKEFMRASDETIYAAVKNLMTKNQEYVFKDLAFGVKGESTQASKGVQPPSVKGGGKERGFIKTVREAETTAEPVAKKVKGFYTPITNKDTMEAASKAVNTEGWDVVKQRVLNSPLSAKTNAEGLELMRRAQDSGRYDDAIEVAESLAKKGTEAGQTVQAFSIWGRLTPEGMLRYAQKQIDNANENMGAVTKFIRKKTGKDVEVKLTSKDAKKITELMTKAGKETSEAKKMKLTKEALDVVNEKLPWGVSDILDEYRYNNMLSNPKSHIRNAYSNALNTFITRPATLVAEGKPVEAAKYYGGVLGSIPSAFKRATKTMAGEVEIKKPDIKEIKKGKLPTVMQLPTRAMEAGDQFFSTMIKQGMQAAGYSAEEAKKAAAYSLYRTDVGKGGEGIINDSLDKVSNWLYRAPKGVRWFVPFIRTPMNVAKQWIDYSPAGAINIIGNKNIREQSAKALIGSAAMLGGAYFAGEDKTTWAAPTDSTAKQLFYASGRKPFSFKLGDKWVPMYYLGPFAFAVALPAAIKNYQEDSRESLTDSQLQKLTDASTDLLKFVIGQTPLTGLNSFGKIISGDMDYTIPKQLGFTASQTIPFTGLLNYIADVLDPVYRKPKGFVESIKQGIPGMTEGIQPYLDPFGKPSMRLPINYTLPYDIGIEQSQFDQPLKVRTDRLKQNAVENSIKKQVGESQGSEMYENKFFYFDPESGNTRSIDLGKFQEPALTSWAKTKRDKERFSTAMDVYRSDGIGEEDKKMLYATIGVKEQDLEYYDVASEVNDVKYSYVMDEISNFSSKEEMLKFLIENRRLVNGKMVAADGVIDDLYDEGYITSEERSAIKDFKITQEGDVKVKVSGRGKTAKFKTAKFVPLKLKTSGYKAPSAPKIQTNMSFPSNQFQMPKLKVRIPEQSTYNVKFNL